MMKTLLERLEDPRPLIYDGGFGSELFVRGIELTNSTLANESNPEAVVDIHSAYIGAGSDVIATNTFVGSVLHLEMAGKDESEADRLARLAVAHARAAVEKSGKEIYIAGSMGPSPGAIEADSGDTEFGISNVVARDAHERLVNSLAEAGVDFFTVETMFSAKEAAMIVDAARRTGLPIAVNMTFKYTADRKTGKVVYRTDWGHSAADLLEMLAGGEFSGGDNLLDHVQIVGVNCGAESSREAHTGMPYAVQGIRQTREAIEEKGIRLKRMMAYPNAGMPRLDKDHRTVYSQTPEDMASGVADLLKEGAYLIGGCCGTSPAHIRAFREVVDAEWDF